MAASACVKLARDHGLDPAHLAHAFVLSRPFLTASIIGATRMEQLKVDLAAKYVKLGKEVLDGIEAIHKIHTYPCP